MNRAGSKTNERKVLSHRGQRSTAGVAASRVQRDKSKSCATSGDVILKMLEASSSPSPARASTRSNFTGASSSAVLALTSGETTQISKPLFRQESDSYGAGHGFGLSTLWAIIHAGYTV